MIILYSHTVLLLSILLTGVFSLQSLTDFTNSLQLLGTDPSKLTLPSTGANFVLGQTQLTSSTTAGTQPCTCGVFLTGQFTKGSSAQPKGNPALTHEQDHPFTCSPHGIKLCQNKCLENMVKHLPNSADLLCATLDRDCYKERAYLFVQNCDTTWHNTNLAAGREYCCKDGKSYQCPLI